MRNNLELDPLGNHDSRIGFVLRSGWFTIISLLFIAFSFQSSSAASRGYLTTVGPAPLRFSKSSKSDQEAAIMKPYLPSQLNPQLQAKATNAASLISTPSEDVATLTTDHPSHPTVEENEDPHDIASTSNVSPESDDSPEHGDGNRNQESNADANTITAGSDLDVAPPPTLQVAPMIPQMLLHFFENDSSTPGASRAKAATFPMTFTPPISSPLHSSKAVYRRSPH